MGQVWHALRGAYTRSRRRSLAIRCAAGPMRLRSILCLPARATLVSSVARVLTCTASLAGPSTLVRIPVLCNSLSIIKKVCLSCWSCVCSCVTFYSIGSGSQGARVIEQYAGTPPLARRDNRGCNHVGAVSASIKWEVLVGRSQSFLSTITIRPVLRQASKPVSVLERLVARDLAWPSCVAAGRM